MGSEPVEFAAVADCRTDAADNSATDSSYGRANIDTIYRLVLSNDDAMRRAAEAAANSITIPPMPASDLTPSLSP